jgi:acyl-CoA thioester hydrolase
MAKSKIELPSSFPFSTKLTVRITDLNYGNHVGNDSILSMLHEARVRFLEHYGLEELKFEGVGLIMRDVIIEFKNEIFYRDVLTASVAVGGFTRAGFDIYYKIEKEDNEKKVLAVAARTGMICYNYELKEITAVPEKAQLKLEADNRE